MSSLWLLLGGVLVVLGYMPGLTGALYYDDYSNLEGLSTVIDSESAMRFVLEGHAGPLGRPLALATFIPMASGWPDNSSLGLAVNLAIHVANFLLLYFLGVMLLSRANFLSEKDTKLAALLAAVLWAVLPILASSSLILIQRMTGLSAFFGLLGLVGFTYGYRWAEIRPLLGGFLQLGILGLATGLAMLSKENGVLIPVFALIIDFAVQRREGLSPYLRRAVLLVLAMLVLYRVSPLSIDYLAVDAFRGFSPVDRLVTEVVILWEYIFRAFIPLAPTSFGPFHDYYGVRSPDLYFFYSLVGWVILIAFAFLKRKITPLILFGVVWFLVGHLVESTAVMLELYFEHRNYLALWGMCLFFGWSVCWLRGKIGRLALIGGVGYIIVMWIILFSMTTLWGQKSLAAETWASKHPGSARAALHAVFIELGENNADASYERHVNYIGRERTSYALRVLMRTMRACPDCIDIRMQALIFSCSLQRSEQQRELYDQLIEVAGPGTLTPSAISLMFDLVGHVSEGGCSSVSVQEVADLIELFRDNVALSFPVYSIKLSFSEAMLAESIGDWDKVKRILSAAAVESLESEPILQYQIYAAIESEDLEYGLSALEVRREYISRVSAPGLSNLVEELNQQLNRDKGGNAE